VGDGQWKAAEVHAERAGVEAGIHEETGQEMRADGLAVDGGDEHTEVTAAGHAVLSTFAEEVGETCGDLGALGLVGRQEDEQVRIVAAKPSDELAVAEDDFSVGGAGEDSGRGFRVVVHGGKVGPAQDGTVGVGGIGGCELDKFGLLDGRFGAQLAEQIDGGGKSELRGTEAGDEVAAPDAPGFFEGFEDVVDSAEAAGNVFCGDGFASEDAVAAEELKCEGMRSFGGCGDFFPYGLGWILAFPGLRFETRGTHLRA